MSFPAEIVQLIEQYCNIWTRIVFLRHIELTDRQIDGLVYELYGLTAEEIGVVEGATDRSG